MSIIRWNPFGEFDYLLRNKQLLTTKELSLNVDWAPSVDIVENDKEFLIKTELPEVKKENIKVHVENGILQLKGERILEKTEEKTHRTERYYGTFSRSFSLPENVDKNNINAEYKDGMLYLRLPKAQENQKSTFQISVN